MYLLVHLWVNFMALMFGLYICYLIIAAIIHAIGHPANHEAFKDDE